MVKGYTEIIDEHLRDGIFILILIFFYVVNMYCW